MFIVNCICRIKQNYRGVYIEMEVVRVRTQEENEILKKPWAYSQGSNYSI